MNDSPLLYPRLDRIQQSIIIKKSNLFDSFLSLVNEEELSRNLLFVHVVRFFVQGEIPDGQLRHQDTR